MGDFVFDGGYPLLPDGNYEAQCIKHNSAFSTRTTAHYGHFGICFHEGVKCYTSLDTASAIFAIASIPLGIVYHIKYRQHRRP